MRRQRNRGGHLNNYYSNLTKNSGHLNNKSLNINDKDGYLDDAIIEYAMVDERPYSSTIPFWLEDHGLKIKPSIFLGRLTRRSRKKRL